MATIKISSKVEEADWRALQALARELHQRISGLLSEAIRDYLQSGYAAGGSRSRRTQRTRC